MHESCRDCVFGTGLTTYWKPEPRAPKEFELQSGDVANLTLRSTGVELLTPKLSSKLSLYLDTQKANPVIQEYGIDPYAPS